jgi:hypothetical protein
VERFDNLPADTLHTLKEGSGEEGTTTPKNALGKRQD